MGKNIVFHFPNYLIFDSVFPRFDIVIYPMTILFQKNRRFTWLFSYIFYEIFFFFFSFCLRHHKTHFPSFPYSAHQVGFVSIRQIKYYMEYIRRFDYANVPCALRGQTESESISSCSMLLHKRYQNIWSHIFIYNSSLLSLPSQ